MRLISAAFAASLVFAGAAAAAPVPQPDLRSLAQGERQDSIVDAQYMQGGRRYCWYPNGWQGPGWYRCGYNLRRGYGWGGGPGWRGWAVPGGWNRPGWQGGHPGWNNGRPGGWHGGRPPGWQGGRPPGPGHNWQGSGRPGHPGGGGRPGGGGHGGGGQGGHR